MDGLPLLAEMTQGLPLFLIVTVLCMWVVPLLLLRGRRR